MRGDGANTHVCASVPSHVTTSIVIASTSVFRLHFPVYAVVYYDKTHTKKQLSIPVGSVKVVVFTTLPPQIARVKGRKAHGFDPMLGNRCYP